jgi:pyruvate,water dikinase
MHIFGSDPDDGWDLRRQAMQPGAKARSLIRLCQSGFPVPPFFVLPASALRLVLEQDPQWPAMIAELDRAGSQQVPAMARQLREAILELTWPPKLERDFLQSVDRLLATAIDGDSRWLAVRASPCQEVADDFGPAGRLKCFLCVSGADDAMQKVRQVWASAFTDEAIAWRRQQGYSAAGSGMGVIIQRMIEPAVSGDCQTCHPASGRGDEMTVRTVLGAGGGRWLRQRLLIPTP